MKGWGVGEPWIVCGTNIPVGEGMKGKGVGGGETPGRR